MIIALFVFSSLLTGIAKMGDTKSVGRIGAKTLAWFLGASLISLVLGLMVMNMVNLGVHLNLPVPDVSEAGKMENGSALTFKTFISHVFPRSFVEAMANNEILQIVVFAIFFGLATAAVGEKGKVFIRVLDSLTEIVLKITGYVMYVAPLAAFAAVSAILSLKGPEILITYGKFIGIFYLSILFLWFLIISISYLWIGRKVFVVLKNVKDLILLAFTTASSEAAFPRLIEALEKSGCPKKIVSFVLPLGY